ncbi:MAG: TetR/AcrR family transcriptional regulator [Planctomycetota bacterium]|nr:TetR/AcrR family transcriptional regulator [Planctomycetota bacterium]
MGRYEDGHRQQTQGRIIKTASRLFREQGFHATGLAQIMKESGLTVGGFYKHFESKTELFEKALEDALKSSQTFLAEDPGADTGAPWLALLASFYLNPIHADNPGRGCPLPSLLSEVARAPSELRQSCENQLLTMIEGFDKRNSGLAPEESRAKSWSVLASLVGGMVLARSVASAEIRDEILASCQDAIAGEQGNGRPQKKDEKP